MVGLLLLAALLQDPDEAAVREPLARLASPDPAEREAATQALVDLGPAARRWIAPLADSADAELAGRARSILHEYDRAEDREAIEQDPALARLRRLEPDLAEILTEDAPERRWQLGLRFGQLGTLFLREAQSLSRPLQRQDFDPYSLQWILLQLMAGGPAEWLPAAAARWAASEDGPTREVAALAARYFDWPGEPDLLESLVRHGSRQQRVQSMVWLAQEEPLRAATLLREMTAAEARTVRSTCLESFARYGPDDLAAEALVALEPDDAGGNRSLLPWLGSRARPALLPRVEEMARSGNSRRRIRALYLLSRWGRRGWASDYAEALAPTDETLAEPQYPAVLAALPRTPLTERIESLLNDERPTARSVGCLVAAERFVTEVAEEIRSCIGDPDPPVARAAIRAAGRLGDRLSIPGIRARLADPDERVGGAAVLALVHLQDREIAAVLAEQARGESYEEAFDPLLAMAGWREARPAVLRAVEAGEFGQEALPWLGTSQADLAGAVVNRLVVDGFGTETLFDWGCALSNDDLRRLLAVAPSEEVIAEGAHRALPDVLNRLAGQTATASQARHWLCTCGRPEQREAAIAAMRAAGQEVSCQEIADLMTVTSDEAAALFRARLDSDDLRQRRDAAFRWFECARPQDRPILVDWARRQDDPSVVQHLLSFLMYADPGLGRDLAAPWLDHPGMGVREAAARLLPTPEAVRVLIALNSPWEVERGATVLAGRPDAASDEWLLEAARSVTSSIPMIVLRLRGRTDLLRSLLEDPARRVAAAAAAQLALAGDPLVPGILRGEFPLAWMEGGGWDREILDALAGGRDSEAWRRLEFCEVDLRGLPPDLVEAVLPAAARAAGLTLCVSPSAASAHSAELTWILCERDTAVGPVGSLLRELMPVTIFGDEVVFVVEGTSLRVMTVPEARRYWEEWARER